MEWKLTNNFFCCHCSLCRRCGSAAIRATSYCLAHPGPLAFSSSAFSLNPPYSGSYLPGPSSVLCNEMVHYGVKGKIEIYSIETALSMTNWFVIIQYNIHKQILGAGSPTRNNIFLSFHKWYVTYQGVCRPFTIWSLCKCSWCLILRMNARNIESRSKKWTDR